MARRMESVFNQVGKAMGGADLGRKLRIFWALVKFKMPSSHPSGEVRCESGVPGRGQAEIEIWDSSVHSHKTG